MGRRNSETACRLDSGRNGAAPTIGIDLSGATLCGYYAWCYLYFPGSVGTTAPDDSHKWKARDMSHISDVGSIALFSRMWNEGAI